VWLAVAWLGIVGSGLAYTFAYFVLEHWGASRYTLVTYVLPVMGLTLGAIFLGEVIDWHIAAGSVLVIGGIVLASVATGRKARSRANAEPSEASERREPASAAGR
jgi:drug/metabolite transporter (DMT)-like permease